MKAQRLTVTFAAAILIFGIMSTPASAAICTSSSTTSCSIDLTVANSTSALGSPASYGLVSLSLVSGNIDVSVALTSGYFLINQGFGFNTTLSPAPTLTSPTSFPTGYTFLGTPGSSMFDGFGNFTYRVDAPNNGSGNEVNSLSFEVQTTGGFSSVGQLVAGSVPPGGLVPSLFVADVINNSGTCTGGACTGFVGTGSAVPEPTSYLTLLLAGLGALCWVTERRRNHGAVAN